MSKQIKIPDATYDRLKGAADVHYRTIGAQIEWMMDFIGGKVPSETTPSPKNTIEKNFEGQAPQRSVPQILTEITSLSESREEELEYCQDKEERVRIELEYGARIQQLWDEYNNMKDE